MVYLSAICQTHPGEEHGMNNFDSGSEHIPLVDDSVKLFGHDLTQVCNRHVNGLELTVGGSPLQSYNATKVV